MSEQQGTQGTGGSTAQGASGSGQTTGGHEEAKTILGGTAKTEQAGGGAKTEQTAITADSWLNAIPEQFRADPNLTKYKSLDGFVEGHLNAVKLIGQKGVERPRDAAEYGWPTAKGQDGKDSPLLAMLKPEDQDAVRKAMFEVGVPKGTAPQLLKTLDDVYAKVEARNAAAFQTHLQDKYHATVEALAQQFGSAWPGKVEGVKALLVKFPELKAFIDEHKNIGADVDANLTIGLMKLAEEFKESDLVRGITTEGGSFDGEVARIKNSDAYNRPDHPQHEQAVKQLAEVYRTKDPRNR